jgi:hypothetical protein
MVRNRPGRRLSPAVLLLALALALFGAAQTGRAENLGPGGGTRVVVGDQVIGPYSLWVTTSPEPAQVGMLTIDVRVSDPASGKKITDATIDVELVNPEDGTRLTGAVTHKDAGNPIDYAAHIQMPAAGSWNGTLRINGSAGQATVTFTQRVLEPRSSSTLVVLGLPFLVMLLGLGGVWYWRAGSHRGT